MNYSACSKRWPDADHLAAYTFKISVELWMRAQSSQACKLLRLLGTTQIQLDFWQQQGETEMQVLNEIDFV